MHPKYPNIFSPIKIGPIELKNRFYSSPHVCPLCTPNGEPTDEFAAYYAEKVKGGCGLVMVSMNLPHRARSVQPSPESRDNLPGLRKLTDAVHDAGGKIIGELWYYWGRAGRWSPLSTPGPTLGASTTQYNHFGRKMATREMTKAEIKGMVNSFRTSAINLRDAGFDGVMLHAAHGAIAEQFLSPYFNRRTDEYGGSIDNRMRFLHEVLGAFREIGGDKFAVGMRLNCDEVFEGGYHTEDAYQILKKTADSGLIDFADLDIAVEPTQFHLGMPPVYVPPMVYRPYVEKVRKAAGKIPVLSVLGRQTDLADGESALASGVCDMVGAARALIADPYLVKNAFDGKEDRTRPCIACNWCMASLPEGMQTCTVNPTAWKERQWGAESFTPAARKSKVTVIGGGPGGLEAARVCALRGHDVTLYELREQLGGALRLWATIPGREFYQKSVDWWERELKQLGVKISLGKPATAAGILAEKPDAVVVATGARYSKGGRSDYRDLDIPGHDRDYVHLPDEVLLGKVRPSGKVIVLDGDGMTTAVSIAEVLGKAGAEVEFLTADLGPLSLRTQLHFETPAIMERLRAAKVKISPATYIRGIGGNRAVTVHDVYSDDERVIEGVDAVILATGREPANELEKELDGKVPQLFVVGDAAAPRMWAAASYEGHKFARYIGEPNAPASMSDLYFGPED